VYKIFDAAVIRTIILIIDKIVDVRRQTVTILVTVFILSSNSRLFTIEHAFELFHQIVIHPLF